jgi:hypothetical protein
MADVWTEFVDIGGEAYDRWSAEHAFVLVEHASIPAEFVAIAADEPTDQPSSCSPENEAEDTAALIAALDAGNWPAVHALVARPGFRGSTRGALRTAPPPSTARPSSTSRTSSPRWWPVKISVRSTL